MRFQYIDVLKAIAIIAIVFYHIGIMPYGYLGVDLFLVISGFLVTKSLNKLFLSKEYHIASYFSFELKRVVRLLPLLLLAGGICMVAGFFVMLPDDYENLSESVVATNLFANNILAAITTKDYWNVVNEYKPLMHTWYVGVLMQFYVLYPLVYYIAYKRDGSSKGALLRIISFFAIISLFIYLVTNNIAARFYFLPTRFFEFAIGGIVAMSWKPRDGARTFPNFFVFACYIALILLMVLDVSLIPSSIRLLLVVLLSAVLIRSNESLENSITANVLLANIGAASYSIYVWHQPLLAFYRYTHSELLSFWSILIFLFILTIISWLSYNLIEKKVSQLFSNKQRRPFFYCIIAISWVLLTGFSIYIYYKGGVVRDVPELYIEKNQKTDHKAYNDKIYELDTPFKTDKLHWLVVGNSFGRDFANVILESPISDSVEVSYIFIDDYRNIEKSERYKMSDKVFLSTLGVDENLISQMEVVCAANGVPIDDLIIVSEKNFGESNGQFYFLRNRKNYFQQRAKVRQSFLEKNSRLKRKYGDRYLDLFELVIDEDATVPVFTPDQHYFSQDCEHFSKGGARYFASLIDWTNYLK